MSPLMGGEFVIAVLAARIALWIWCSRHELRARARDDRPGPDGGGRPLVLPRPALRLVPPPAADARRELPRAA